MLCRILYSVRFAFFFLSLTYSCVKRQFSDKNDDALDRLWETKSAESPYLETSGGDDDY